MKFLRLCWFFIKELLFFQHLWNPLNTWIVQDTKYFFYFENCIIYCMRANYPVFETEHSCWNDSFIDILVDMHLGYLAMSPVKKFESKRAFIVVCFSICIFVYIHRILYMHSFMGGRTVKSAHFLKIFLFLQQLTTNYQHQMTIIS